MLRATFPVFRNWLLKYKLIPLLGDFFYPCYVLELDQYQLFQLAPISRSWSIKADILGDISISLYMTEI